MTSENEAFLCGYLCGLEKRAQETEQEKAEPTEREEKDPWMEWVKTLPLEKALALIKERGERERKAYQHSQYIHVPRYIRPFIRG